MSNGVAPDVAISQVVSPMRTLPTFCGDVSVSTSSAVLFTDAENPSAKAARRILVANLDSSATLGIKWIVAAGTATGHVLTSCLRLGPGQVYDGVIGANLRVVAVGSGALTANCLVHDIF